MTNKKIIGLLPASGKAERLNGIPKFLFPINTSQNILEWHIEKMSEICDEIRISTRSIWMPLIKDLNLVDKVTIYEIEPSSFSDACFKMMNGEDAKFIIGMPDIYVHNSNNFYKNLTTANSEILLSTFVCPDSLLGKVGQILFDENNIVIDSIDKDIDCKMPYLWGAIYLDNVKIDPSLSTPGLEISTWIKNKKVIAVPEKGKYIDLGTFEGIKEFYSTI